jgi:hypothetical protein
MTTPAIGDTMILNCYAGGGIDNFGDGKTELLCPARSLDYLNSNGGNSNTNNDNSQLCGCFSNSNA